MACLLTYILQAGHLKMLDGYIDFFMDPSLSECYLQLREELDKLIQKKVSHTLGKFGRFSSDISP
jgi:ATP-dependent RNA helicase DHX36